MSQKLIAQQLARLQSFFHTSNQLAQKFSLGSPRIKIHEIEMVCGRFWANPLFEEIAPRFFRDRYIFDPSVTLWLLYMAPRIWGRHIKRSIPETTENGQVKPSNEETIAISSMRWLTFTYGRYEFDPEFSPWGDAFHGFSVEKYKGLGSLMGSRFPDDTSSSDPCGQHWIWYVDSDQTVFKVRSYYIADYEQERIYIGDGDLFIWVHACPSELAKYIGPKTSKIYFNYFGKDGYGDISIDEMERSIDTSIYEEEYSDALTDETDEYGDLSTDEIDPQMDIAIDS